VYSIKISPPVGSDIKKCLVMYCTIFYVKRRSKQIDLIVVVPDHDRGHRK
jgi:hypothetical protein